MKSNQLILGFLGVAILLFLGAVAYKLSHHAGGKTSVEPAKPPVATAVSVPPPAPPPPPTAPATTIKPVKDALKAGVLNPIFYVQAKMRLLKQGLTAALNSHRVHLDDFEKLSFDPGASTDPYNAFNPNGLVRYTPLDNTWLDQSAIDSITTKKGTPLVYNVRRTVDKMGTTDVLYAVIPNIAAANCGVAAGNVNFAAPAALEVQSDTHTIVEDPPGMPVLDAAGCAFMPDGRILWLYNLKVRYQHHGETRWGSR